MSYSEQAVMQAFELFAGLMSEGKQAGKDIEAYLMNDDVRSLTEKFAWRVDCVIVQAGEVLYLVPKTGFSPFHIRTEEVRRELGSQFNNADVYMMYLCILVFIGEFYCSFQSSQIQRDFLTISEWMVKVGERVETLSEHGEEALQRYGRDFDVNWTVIIDKWDAMNDVREAAVRQSGRTISRFNFLYKTCDFMKKQGIIHEIGEDEYELTEKTQMIVQRYFMESEYNRGILQFMYQYERREEEQNASHI
ncbi:hypothetical protein J31TS4_11930 [Paenibacillus sp. J31TS4]|uniref:DUF6063 family protein n=1 Tax=Paenibacillus sp. J31TS4 TaxID=2807195 RepID=UPI001B22B378|nr:DUF6063 family protein [Paenibacillus sp. J31TS4]GIP37913.1 hypothetical protein J31TS4_11930 [Paenibacillus sp. J31TS4]